MTGLGAFCVSLAAPSATQTAVANGDTRTINLFHAHTKESISATYRVGGSYDSAVLKQLNWFLRDWRRDEPTSMDPRLFDVLWETYRSAGAGGREIVVVSAYRSPETNSMLRRRSRAVAKQSQHMAGKAMDTHMPGMSMAQVREIAMKLQRGGVGYYPTAGTPFVHLDVGSVRSWPRMGYDQLVRLFPDGKTVHLPANGQPLARYEEARAELEAGGGVYLPPSSNSKGFFAWLFGGGGGEDDEVAAAAPTQRYQRGAMRTAARGRAQTTQVAAYAPTPASSVEDDSSARNFFIAEANRSAPVARAERNLPRGETFVAPPPAAPQQTAALAPVEARTPKPEPLAPASDEGAAADTSNQDRNAPEKAAPDISAPLPPRRPSDLPLLAAAPLPPMRPTELAALGPAKAANDLPLLAAQPRGALAPQVAGLRAAVTPAATPAAAEMRGASSAAKSVAPLLGPGIAGPRVALRAHAGLTPRAEAQPTVNAALANAPTPPPRPRRTN